MDRRGIPCVYDMLSYLSIPQLPLSEIKGFSIYLQHVAQVFPLHQGQIGSHFQLIHHFIRQFLRRFIALTDLKKGSPFGAGYLHYLCYCQPIHSGRLVLQRLKNLIMYLSCSTTSHSPQLMIPNKKLLLGQTFAVPKAIFIPGVWESSSLL